MIGNGPPYRTFYDHLSIYSKSSQKLFSYNKKIRVETKNVF